ncbi:hypothetical protein [Natrinema salifodinae]|uniref:Uncharacterized protein n=1 Tax=Natrinema salifodinae TaxID=1202768 RepID=A0A1I0P759_9EURY|nr:hypothetical protein [Natrinema salifodinae]SEW10107.1 hypothetical protein SAMN05216285_2223 [Natrinema salifodinae]
MQFLVKEIIDAEITVPTDDVGWSLVDVIDPDRLPGKGPWQVQSVSYGDREMTVKLGNGQSAEDLIEQMNDRVPCNNELV